MSQVHSALGPGKVYPPTVIDGHGGIAVCPKGCSQWNRISICGRLVEWTRHLGHFDDIGELFSFIRRPGNDDGIGLGCGPCCGGKTPPGHKNMAVVTRIHCDRRSLIQVMAGAENDRIFPGVPAVSGTAKKDLALLVSIHFFEYAVNDINIAPRDFLPVNRDGFGVFFRDTDSDPGLILEPLSVQRIDNPCVDVFDRITLFIVVVIDKPSHKNSVIGRFRPVEHDAAVIKKAVCSGTDHRIGCGSIAFQWTAAVLLLGVTIEKCAFPGLAAVEGLEHTQPRIP